jgi:cobalt transporter subunit CbtA
MLNRILAACLAAGVLAGLSAAILQHFATTPLILAAEAFETSGAAASQHGAAMDGAGAARLIPAGGHDHADALAGQAEWAPGDGLERSAYSAVVTIVTAFGFALMLLSAMLLGGAAITAHTGLAWAAAAFVATGLAPSLGLSPELPGAAAAELAARQLWWAGTAAATVAGLWLALRLSTRWAIGAGLVLIVLPHLIGAPHPHELTSKVPAELAGQFASASLVVQAVIWALVGATAGYVWQRTGRQAAA